MNTDPIDRALGGDASEPSPDFAARVMRAVEREAATPPPLPFPWRRLVLGVAAAVLWLGLGYRAVRGGDAAEVRALAQSTTLLAGLGVLVAGLCLRVVRFCVRA